MSALEPGDRDALHRVLRARRDVRTGFVDTPVDDERLHRVLAAAHAAPSVGFSQPWDFLVLRSPALRDELATLAQQQRREFAASLPAARARQFAGLRVEAIREAPLGVVVTCDPTRGGRHVLGRHTQPRMAAHSVAGAVQNLWLAARAEELGVGWVSFFDERVLARTLHERVGMPLHLEVVAYLCVGHVEGFADEPELATAGWARRRPLAWAVHTDTWGNHAMDPLDETLAALADLDTTERRGRGARAPDAHDRAARRARGGRRARRAPGRARRELPAAAPGAGRRRDLRGRPRGARPRGDAVAAGGHGADGRELPRRRRRGERVRRDGGRRGRRWSTSGSPPTSTPRPACCRARSATAPGT